MLLNFTAEKNEILESLAKQKNKKVLGTSLVESKIFKVKRYFNHLYSYLNIIFYSQLIYTSLKSLPAAATKWLQSCSTLQPHRWQPTRLPCPWDLQAITLEWVAISFSDAGMHAC